MAEIVQDDARFDNYHLVRNRIMFVDLKRADHVQDTGCFVESIVDNLKQR